MATFSFEPALLRKLSNAEKEIIKPYRGSKNKLTTVSEQYFFTLTTAEYSYKTTFARKVAKADDKIEILKRRSKPLTDTQMADLRAKLKGDWSKPVLAWEVERETFRVELEREVEYLDERLQIDSVVERGQRNHSWVVEDVEIVSKPNTAITTEEVSPQRLYVGHLYGGRKITKVVEHSSPVNKIISKLCRLQNNGVACSSGQQLQSRTVKTLHASREPIPAEAISYAQVAADKRANRTNKLEQIPSFMRGDYSEHVVFNDKGGFVSREVSVAADESNRGWQEHKGEFTTIKLKPSEGYKPISLPSEYKEDEVKDKPDAPVTIDLGDAEKKLKAMGFL